MDYASFVKKTESQYLEMLGGDAGSVKTPVLPKLGTKPQGSGPAGRPIVLIVAPHPDDECLMGGYALRMKLEWQARVCVFAFTLGSKKERQAERLEELKDACAVLNFEVVEGADLTAVVAGLNPDFIFAPHAEDGHPAHQRAHEAAVAAMNTYLKAHPKKVFRFLQTEFWHAMKQPNLLIPLSSDEVALIGLALMKHVGEVSRNPYHLRLPSWYMDQVRRGSEQVAGMGQSGHGDWVFGQLYLSTTYGL
ncbi:MAG: PIG-L family deacetylase [Bdellovibrionales bacterium]|nr:PIG-L family deacetylase [Bdellovibrionales bacterium]